MRNNENKKMAKERCDTQQKSLLSQTFYWLGWLDSNQRMTESESVALPLGDTPMNVLSIAQFL